MSFIAPAGTPLPVLLYASALLEGLTDAGATAKLARTLAQHSGHTRGFLFSTGRAAMVVALEALREAANDPRRTEVIVSGYTCYSVPASVLRAGLRPRLCDVDPRTLSFDLDDLQRFDATRVLAVVSANLYGLPNAMDQLESWARRSGVALLDDAAQALGARLANRPVGGFGDIGLYSLDKGKNITSLEGGALVVSTPLIADAIERRWQALPGVKAAHALVTAAKLAAYSLLLRPSLYGITRKLPFLGLGLTRYEDDYPLLKYPRLLAGFGNRLYARLPELTRIRRANAERLRESLRNVSAVEFVAPLPGAEPGYTRLPVLARNPESRSHLITALQEAGIGATASYPAALCDVPELANILHESDRRLPGARDIAARIMTIPVHPYCPGDHAEKVAQVLLRDATGSAVPARAHSP